jgi:hypothetical protein
MHKKGLCKKVSSCGTNRKTCYHISGRSVDKSRFVYFVILFWLVFLYWHEIKFSDYKIKMQNLEYSESIPKCDYRKIHNCKRCPYVTRSIFFMVNHAKRHPLPLKSLSSERNDLEKFYCKDCNFETDLGVILKQHLRKYHRKDTDCVQDQLRNDTVVKSYICQKCSFETYSVLLWTKHLGSLCVSLDNFCFFLCTCNENNEIFPSREVSDLLSGVFPKLLPPLS